MKRIKLFIAAIVLVFSVASVVAFTTKEEKTLTPVWYLYNGTGDFDNPSSYTKDGEQIPMVCDGDTEALCAIKLPDNGTNPSQSDLDPTFVSHIEQVVSSQDPDDLTVRLKEE